MTRQVLIAIGALALVGVPFSAAAHSASASRSAGRPITGSTILTVAPRPPDSRQLVMRNETAQHGRGGRALGARPRGGSGAFGTASPRTVAPFRRRFFARPFFFSPFAFGGFGLGFAYDPFFWGYGWGNPFWGYPYWGYPPYYGYGYGYGGYGSGYGYGGRGYERYGSVRLDVKPSSAEVYADGYYMGQVRDFDGAFHHLELTPGEHKIEIRGSGSQPLIVNMKIAPGRTVTYRADLNHGPGTER